MGSAQLNNNGLPIIKLCIIYKKNIKSYMIKKREKERETLPLLA
jgi:hypothetical protein